MWLSLAIAQHPFVHVCCKNCSFPLLLILPLLSFLFLLLFLLCSGQCYPCTQEVAVTCCCGHSSITVPCGRERRTKPPSCSKPCSTPPSCHHHQRPPHACHFGRCPPCREPCLLSLQCGHNCRASCHSEPITVSVVCMGLIYHLLSPYYHIHSFLPFYQFNNEELGGVFLKVASNWSLFRAVFTLCRITVKFVCWDLLFPHAEWLNTHFSLIVYSLSVLCYHSLTDCVLMHYIFITLILLVTSCECHCSLVQGVLRAFTATDCACLSSLHWASHQVRSERDVE